MKLTLYDVSLIPSRCTHIDNTIPEVAMCLFVTNREADAFNEQKLSTMQGESCVVNSFDTTFGSGTASSTLLRTFKQHQDTFGLANSVFLQVGAHYIVTNYVDVTD
jgi:hypothetical protein